MNYSKDKKRVSLNNTSVAAVPHTRDIAKVTKNLAAPFTPTDLAVNLQCVLDYRLEW